MEKKRKSLFLVRDSMSDLVQASYFSESASVFQ